jgi:hypothetical protein
MATIQSVAMWLADECVKACAFVGGLLGIGSRPMKKEGL